MTVLFEDAHIIVCLKPAGILSQGDDKGRENMISILGGNVFPVHRLDRETAGIMVFAKTAESAAAMSILVQSHENFRKEYLAVLEGVLTKREDVFEDLLYHDALKNKSYVVNKKRRGVKSAKLSYETQNVTQTEDGKMYALVRVKLYTGRTHQIRVQFASRHVPLAGDRKYGASADFKALALFACALSFCHPITGETLSFEVFPKKEGAFGLFEPHNG